MSRRCEICDYCVRIGQSTYADTTGHSAGAETTTSSNPLEAYLKNLDTHGGGSGMSAGNQSVWPDKFGMLCQSCRSVILMTIYDDVAMDKVRKELDSEDALDYIISEREEVSWK